MLLGIAKKALMSRTLKTMAAVVLLAYFGAPPTMAEPGPGKKHRAKGQAGVLRIRNQSPFVAVVYIGGVRAGWLRAFRTGRFKGLKPGYHKIYAVSEYGSAQWGPEEVAVPGVWNLDMEQKNEAPDLAAALASRIFRANKSSLLACDRIAEKRGETTEGLRVSFGIKVNAEGQGVVAVEGEGLGQRLSSCYEAVVKQWKFPKTGQPYQLDFVHLH